MKTPSNVAPTICLLDTGIPAAHRIVRAFLPAWEQPTPLDQVRERRLAEALAVIAAATNDNRAIDEGLSQHFTRSDVAEQCVKRMAELVNMAGHQIVDPSAGSGAFFKILPAGTIGYDVEPRHPGVETADFLQVEFETARPVIVIGNPPFGQGANTAIDFFNHGARQSAYVGMIVPQTFRKMSVLKRLNRDFHLLAEWSLPKNSFLFRGKRFDVRANFQIWERRDYRRALPRIETTHPDFEFTTRDRADFAIQRVGGQAGRVYDPPFCSDSSTYFIRSTNRRRVRRLKKVMSQLDFVTPAANSVDYPSLAMAEIVALYRERTEGIPTDCAAPPAPPLFDD